MLSKINSNIGGVQFGITEDGKPGWKDGADTVHPFSSAGYKHVLYTSNAGTGSATASLTAPDTAKDSLIMFTSNFYTGLGAEPTIILPDGLIYDVLLNLTVIDGTGSTSTNRSAVEIISAKDVANKTFSIRTNAGYNRGFVWMFY